MRRCGVVSRACACNSATSAAKAAVAGEVVGQFKSGDVHWCQRTRVTDPKDALFAHALPRAPEPRPAFTSANVRATRSLRNRMRRASVPAIRTTALASDRSAISQGAVFVDPPLMTCIPSSMGEDADDACETIAPNSSAAVRMVRRSTVFVNDEMRTRCPEIFAMRDRARRRAKSQRQCGCPTSHRRRHRARRAAARRFP